MKTVNIIIFFSLFLSFINNTLAQERNTHEAEIYGIRYSQIQRIEGNPYLLDNWSQGNINLFNGETIQDLKMKFDILNNELVFYHDHFKTLFKADKSTVLSFIMNPGKTDSLFFIKYSGTELGYKLKNDNFLQVLYFGNKKFIVKRTAEISDANDTNSKDKINPLNYYFIIEKNDVSEIKLKLKSLFKLYPMQKQEIKKLASQIKFRRKSEEDMVRLIKQIDLIK